MLKSFIRWVPGYSADENNPYTGSHPPHVQFVQPCSRGDIWLDFDTGQYANHLPPRSISMRVIFQGTEPLSETDLICGGLYTTDFSPKILGVENYLDLLNTPAAGIFALLRRAYKEEIEPQLGQISKLTAGTYPLEVGNDGNATLRLANGKWTEPFTIPTLYRTIKG